MLLVEGCLLLVERTPGLTLHSWLRLGSTLESLKHRLLFSGSAEESLLLLLRGVFLGTLVNSTGLRCSFGRSTVFSLAETFGLELRVLSELLAGFWSIILSLEEASNVVCSLITCISFFKSNCSDGISSFSSKTVLSVGRLLLKSVGSLSEVLGVGELLVSLSFSSTLLKASSAGLILCLRRGGGDSFLAESFGL